MLRACPTLTTFWCIWEGESYLESSLDAMGGLHGVEVG